jgi:hypothetical protein
MAKGVIYFNLGSKCLLRAIVSIHSLRKHYDGPIAIISTGDVSNSLCKSLFKNTNIQIIEAVFSKSLEGKNDVYLKKASVNDWTPFDISVFLDADTLVRGPIDELFDLAEKHDFVVPQFTHWTTTGTKAIKRRIEGWETIYPELMEDAHSFGPAVNCGVFAFKKNTEFAVKWCDDIKPGRSNFIPDETGMQVVLHKYKHTVCDQKYNVSCKHSDPYDKDAKIIHYHGRKHCRMNEDGKIQYGGDLWIKEYEKAIEENFLNIIDAPDDRMFRKYKNFKPKNQITDKRITIVTAVNPPYLEKLKITLPTWQKKPQLKDCPMIVFHNGFANAESDLAFIAEVTGRNVKLVEWTMDTADSTRELMLSAFVLGAPYEVETPYWLKIDGDAYFTDSQDIILDHFYEHDLAGHKWKYTKPGKWICDLDDWAFNTDVDGDSYLTEEQRAEAEASKRYGHRRIASFVCLHQTEFTKEAAEAAGKKLPVPSHDTYLWYMAERLPDRKWCWHSYKKLGCGNQTDINKLRQTVTEVQNA